MKYLRSSVVHHLGLDALELRGFRGKKLKKRGVMSKYFQGKYSKPQYEMFQRHCQKVIQEHDLNSLRLRGKAMALRESGRGWEVETDCGTLNAKRVVLAIGLSEQPRWPKWALPHRHEASLIHHIFDPAFRIENISAGARIAIVGGGMTGAQVAIHLAEKKKCETTLFSRRQFTCHQFDSDPCFIGEKCMRDFRRISCLEKRRETIRDARYPGSLTPEVHAELQILLCEGRLRHRCEEITGAKHAHDNSRIELMNQSDESLAVFDYVILCTGFEQTIPGGAFIQNAIKDHGLSTAPCGYPIVKLSLEWSRNLFVMGPLSELEMGPIAHNITGARQAANRITAHV